MCSRKFLRLILVINEIKRFDNLIGLILDHCNNLTEYLNYNFKMSESSINSESSEYEVYESNDEIAEEVTEKI